MKKLILLFIFVAILTGCSENKNVATPATLQKVSKKSGLQIIIDTTTTPDCTYICSTNSGNSIDSGFWKIQRIKNGQITHADGSDEFVFNASKKETYDYSIPKLGD